MTRHYDVSDRAGEVVLIAKTKDKSAEESLLIYESCWKLSREAIERSGNLKAPRIIEHGDGKLYFTANNSLANTACWARTYTDDPNKIVIRFKSTCPFNKDALRISLDLIVDQFLEIIVANEQESTIDEVSEFQASHQFSPASKKR